MTAFWLKHLAGLFYLCIFVTITKLLFVTDEQTILWDLYKNKGKVPENSHYDQKKWLQEVNTFDLQCLSLFLGTYI